MAYPIYQTKKRLARSSTFLWRLIAIRERLIMVMLITWHGNSLSTQSKEELSRDKNEIYSGSSTPDLSFDNLTGIGNLSGVARKFMTIDATIKASENMEVFGPVATAYHLYRCIRNR